MPLDYVLKKRCEKKRDFRKHIYILLMDTTTNTKNNHNKNIKDNTLLRNMNRVAIVSVKLVLFFASYLTFRNVMYAIPGNLRWSF